MPQKQPIPPPTAVSGRMSPRRWLAATVGALAAALGTAGCAKPDDDRPPPASMECPEDDQDCFGAAQVHGSGSSAGGAGGQGALGAGGAVEAGETTLTGRVVEYVDDEFLLTGPYSGQGEVTVPGADGGLSTAPIVGDTFELDGALAAAGVWVLVEPGSGSDLLASLQLFDTARYDSIEVAAVSASLFDLLLGSLSTAPLRDSGAAQIAVRFVDGDDAPQSAITVEPLTVDQPVAYRLPGVWTHDALGTDATGLALLVNVPASPLPGSDTPVTFATEAGSQHVAWVPAIAGAVTYVMVLVP